MASVLERSISTDITENLLQCPICRCQFMKPKVLSCQHSFCAKCLKGWLQTRSKNTNRVKCAVCRMATVLPPHGVDALPENYAIKGLISLLKERGNKVATATSVKKAAAPTKKTPSKPSAKPGSSDTIKPKSAKGKPPAAPATTAATKTKTKPKPAAGSSGKKDKNANISRQGKKMPNNAGTKKKIEPVKSLDESSSTSESDHSDISSGEDDSDEISSFDDDSELSVASSDETEDSLSGDESDVPPTPTMKNYGEIKLGMEVYVFNHRGKRFAGRVKLLETCTLRPPMQPRTYAGIELDRENTSLITEDLDEIEDSYLSYWLGENEDPCTVVRADDCMPASLVNQLLSETVQ